MQFGQNDYKLVYLDTNIIRDLIDSKDGIDKSFFDKFISKKKNYILCFSFANVCEIRPYKKEYQRFLDLFSKFPCIMFYHYRILLQEEYKVLKGEIKQPLNNNVIRVFTPNGATESYSFKYFIDKISSGLKDLIENEKTELSTVLDYWEYKRKKNKGILIENGITTDKQLMELYLSRENLTVIKDLLVENIIINGDSYLSFPSLRMVEFSLFMRQYTTKKALKVNDIMDIRMSAFTPYVDAIITEGYQADLCKKAKKHIFQMKDLEVYTLRGLREN